MRDCVVEVWILANREHNEDTVYRALVLEAVSDRASYDHPSVLRHGGVERRASDVRREALADIDDSAGAGGRTGSFDEQWQ